MGKDEEDGEEGEWEWMRRTGRRGSGKGWGGGGVRKDGEEGVGKDGGGGGGVGKDGEEGEWERMRTG